MSSCKIYSVDCRFRGFLYVVFKRIGFVIQKGLTAQLVVRLPSIQV
jgi:hypothetical protein